jgi:FkbH-like protein
MTEFHSQELSEEQGRRRAIKCVVWDLDNTLWDGILLEDAVVGLRGEVIDIIKTLDARGILHCIASRNDFEKSMEKLEEFRLREFFLCPQINWNSKVSSIKTIAGSIGIALDAIAFVDDDPFERAEMNFSCPEVLCIDAANLSCMLGMPEMTPEVISSDAKIRRLRYLKNITREKAEAEFTGPHEDFLATLGMVFSIAPAGERDLERAEELTVRTHQLNSTGYTYSFDQLNRFRQSDRHQLLITSLRDKFGSYGKIGLALIECEQTVWTLKLLLMSCRVVSRGVGTILLNHIMEQASKQNVILRAEFVPTDRNRMMYITYKFAGFKEQERHGDCLILENDLSRRQLSPAYIKVRYCSAPLESG